MNWFVDWAIKLDQVCTLLNAVRFRCFNDETKASREMTTGRRSKVDNRFRHVLAGPGEQYSSFFLRRESWQDLSPGASPMENSTAAYRIHTPARICILCCWRNLILLESFGRFADSRSGHTSSRVSDANTGGQRIFRYVRNSMYVASHLLDSWPGSSAWGIPPPRVRCILLVPDHCLFLPTRNRPARPFGAERKFAPHVPGGCLVSRMQSQ